MDAPIESLAPNIQARLKSIEDSIAKASAIDKTLGTATLLQKFYIGVANTKIGRLFIERSIKDAEQFAIEFFTRGDDWIDDATKILYKEGLETAREAIAAQLSSAFGKVLPDDFIFSQTQKRMIWERARFSAESVAATYNSKLSSWVQEVKEAWIFQHGSLRGLNRWNLISKMSRYHRAFQEWKEPQISVSEFGAQWKMATEEFWVANEEGLEIECLILPEIASDPTRDSEVVCATFCGQWWERSMAIVLSFQHPNCSHHAAESRIIGGTIPLFIRIGNYGYNLNALEDS